MFVLFLTCVFGLIKVYVSVEMSLLKDVNKLLAGIDEEIAVERELLSQIDETQGAPVQTQFEQPVEPEINGHNDDTRSYLREKDTLTMEPDIGIGIFEREINMDDPFNEQIMGLIDRQETTQEPIIDNNIGKKPLRSNAEIIETDSVQDFCSFVLEAISEKSDEDLKSLLEGVAITLFRMVDNGIRCVGDPLQELFSRIAIAISDLSPVLFKMMSQQWLQGIDTNRRFTELTKAYADICTAEDKNQLFEVVTSTMNYRLKDNGKQMATNMAERCLTMFLAPVIRGCGTQKVENFMKKLTAQPIPRIISDFVDANTANAPNRRSMSRNLKHIKTEYKKMIRHYILKHPTIFNTFAKHYKHSEERKRRHKHKAHHNFHRKRHHHKHKRHYEKEQINDDEYEITAIVNEETTKKEPLFRGISNRPAEVQKRYTIVETISTNVQKTIMRVSPSVLFRRKGNTIKDLNENVNPTTRILPSNNTILEQIIGESSYSDDETYLKTMIKDAYFHGNETENP